MVINGMKTYVAEVRAGEFPKDEHCYTMISGEEEKFLKMMKNP
jgi:ketopantoate hydroxymethyltransferase